MTDSINSDGTAPNWEARKWGERTDATESLGRVVFSEAGDPMSDAYAVRVEAPRLVNTRSWQRAGKWKHRQFGAEIQLRNLDLPGVHLDLFRSEAEALHELLGEMLGRPAPLPYRTPWWTRAKQWWLRRVWKRKHYAELDAWRASVIEDFTRAGPWS